MSDLQSAIAGLNTIDIKGDPIDALGACSTVLEGMAQAQTPPAIPSPDDFYWTTRKNQRGKQAGGIVRKDLTEAKAIDSLPTGYSKIINQRFC